MRRKNGLVTSFPPVVAGMLLGLLAIRQQWPLGMVVGLVIAAGVLAWLALSFTILSRMAWLRRFMKIAQRLRAGQGETVLAELLARRAAGDESPDLLMALSAAYSYQGRGIEAEPVARAFGSAVEQRGLCRKKDASSKLWCDMAAVSLFDAWVAQGRFAEAAHSLRPRVPNALRPNFMTAVISWGFFLAGDDYNTRAVLAQMQPMTTRVNNQRIVTPMFQFMVFAMRHRMLAEDHRSDLIRLRDQLAEWDDSAVRNADNPYGARLREILDDVRMMLG